MKTTIAAMEKALKAVQIASLRCVSESETCEAVSANLTEIGMLRAERDAALALAAARLVDAERWQFLQKSDDYAACMWMRHNKFEDKAWWAISTEIVDVAMKAAP